MSIHKSERPKSPFEIANEMLLNSKEEIDRQMNEGKGLDTGIKWKIFSETSEKKGQDRIL